MTGAGIMLMSGDVPRGLGVHDRRGERPHRAAAVRRSARGRAWTPTTRTGPCSNPISPTRDRRWPAFSRPGVEAGVRAVFGFPLQVGAVRLGALNLYRDRPGPLTDDQHADALVMADVAAQAVLLLQADAPPGDAGRRAGGERRLPVRRAPGVGHGRRAARRQRRPGADPAAGLRVRQRPTPHRRRRGRRGRRLRFDAGAARRTRAVRRRRRCRRSSCGARDRDVAGPTDATRPRPT